MSGAVIAAAAAIWLASSSGSSVTPLARIIAPFASKCGPANQAFTPTGLTSNYLCRRVVSGSVIDVLAYQFDNSADYQAGLATLNRSTGFRSSGASSTCPPAGGAATGVTGWHSVSTSRYPSHSGQILECYIDGHNHLPLLVWTLPTQRVVLAADDGASGATISTLYSWWTSITVG